MNEKDKKAFEKWWDEIRLRGQSTFGIVAITWQAACEYKQKEIDDLEESLVVRLSKSYIAGKDLSKIIQKNLTNEIEKLQTENAKLRENINGTRVKQMNERIEELLIENAKLRECVEFYAETGNWTRSLLESSTLREINDSDVSWTDTGGTYGEILSGGKRARQCLKELENK